MDTGASGIGKAVAEKFAAEVYLVAIIIDESDILKILRRFH